jgi:hypothetical protein
MPDRLSLDALLAQGSPAFRKLNQAPLFKEGPKGVWVAKQNANLPPDRPSPRPEPKQAVRDGPLAAPQGEVGHAGRISVRITSFRRRLLDPDNLAGGVKYLLDCCRYAQLIPDDRPQDIELVTRQEKVSSKGRERTEIVIES